ncbi:hypothetical protein [Vreelandella sp. EE27]
MADDKFRLPGSSYEELTKIIKSYGQFNAPAGLDDVSKLIGMDRTVISRNAGFLVEFGVLEAGQKKSLTKAGKSLAQSLEHEMPEEIISSWRHLVHENEFATKLISAIKIRNGMDENILQSHIAYSAGQPKKSQYMTGAKTLVDILRAAQLIKEKDGKFVISRSDNVREEDISNHEKQSVEQPIAIVGSQPTEIPVASFSRDHAQAEVKININVSVECSIDDLDDLGSKIKEIINQVNSGENPVDNSEE